MIFPLIIYYLVLIFSQFSILSIIALIISIRFQTILSAVFLGLVAIKSKKNVLNDYLYRYPDCTFIYHNEEEFIEKSALDAISELPAAFGYKIAHQNLETRIYVYSIRPINKGAQRPQNLVAYSTPTGAFNIGNFVFMRDQPSNSSKFGLYHELGHISFDNSLEYHEAYSYYLFFVISLAWLLITTNYSLFTSIVFIVLAILTIIIILESLKVKKTAKFRSEIRADAFAVRFIDELEKKALLNLLYKYPNYFYDHHLSQEENSERRVKLIQNLLTYEKDFDKIHSYKWSTQDSSWMASPSRILFYILSGILAFFAKEIDFYFVASFGAITLFVYVYLRYIVNKHNLLKAKVFQWIRETNAKNLVRKMMAEIDLFSKNEV
ncbi:MAG: hypothetical protein KPEEDBHJ_03664 [Anaerolineales bacterium]|nr:hypothetical protein [Anaerolineales bacterium]